MTLTKLLLLLALPLTAQAQAQAPKIEGNTITLSSPDGAMRIEMCSPQMARITKSADDRFPDNEHLMVVRYQFPPVKFTAEANAKGWEIRTDSMTITVSEKPWLVSLTRPDGRLLYSELDYQQADSQTGPQWKCRLAPDEHFFGFGERMDRLDQRGNRVHLNVELGKGTKPAVGGKDILRANYCPVPFFISSKGYSLFFHTAWPTDYDLGWTQPDAYTCRADGGAADYYLTASDQVETLVRAYQSLTGVCPLMPRSAYGLHVGSYSGGTWKHEECANDRYPVDLVHRLRDERIPFDILWLDSTWRHFNSRFGNGGCCFEFRDTFKDPQAMIDSIYAAHVSMFGLHIRSIVDDSPSSTLYEDAVKAGATHPQADCPGIINFFDPEAAEWWWQNAAMKVARMGVQFVKTDCGGSLRFPEGTQLAGPFSAKERHNLFTIPYAQVPYEKFGQYNHRRGFNHTREGYAGIQRYPFIWAGDWGTEWQWFEPVIRGGLNIGLSGVGYWSHCMGGFEQYSPYDTDLYLRWCQFGMFSPVSILFGMDHPRYHEPWTYGPEAQSIFTKYDSLRYTLLPYIYSNAYTMYRTSRPLMTPLLYDWPKDELTYQLSDQYLFGRAMMICPVTVKGALSRPVYFPGGRWADFWTGERIDGRQHKSFLTPPDLMPIFIREGAIIPRRQLVQYESEAPAAEISLLAFPAAKESDYELYDDDGLTDDYQTGKYALTRITCRLTAGGLDLAVAKPEGKYKTAPRTYRLDAYLDSRPTRVLLNGKPLSDSQWSYDSEKGILSVDRLGAAPLRLTTER